MAMTFAQLKSKCLVEIQDLHPGSVLPAVDREIRRAMVILAKKIGGIRLEVTIPTVSGQRTYGISDNFPVDCMGIYHVSNTSKSGQRIYPITKKDRYETETTGSPNGYYLYSRRAISYDVIPSEAENILISYLGYGEAPTLATDSVFTSLPQLEDDCLWDSIIFEVASVYFRRKREYADSQYYNKLALKARYEAMGLLADMNQDEGLEIKLNDLFVNRVLNQSLERFGNSGDILNIMG